MFRVYAITFILVLAGNATLMAQKNSVPYYELDPVVVTGSRIPYHLSESAYSVSVISREEIEILPADNISDVLKYINGVDVRQRGARGVQADVGIRGGSYEQTLIMVDGVNMSDPQTGHHNMDLPVNLNDIERIEIIKGPAARIYGPNAMGGVINIITRDVNSNSFGGHGGYGEYGYYDLGAQGVLSGDKVSGRLSASRRYSSGYLGGKDTDFDVKTINYKGVLKSGSNKLQLGMGFTDKDFGAYKFYTDTFPDQREKTETFLLYGNADLIMTNMEVMPRIHWRHHKDKYKININGVWNINDHRTDVLGTQVNTLITSGWGTTSIGGEAEHEDMESSSLGDHDRGRQAVFLEHRFYPSDRMTMGLGASAVHYSSWGWEYWPGADMSIELTDEFTWFSSIEKSFRVPTYTELYYVTPANKGNPDLKPEKAWTGETGLRCLIHGITADFSLFYRDSEDVIDWSRRPGETAWQATNIATVRTKGGEVGVTLYPESFFNAKWLSSVGIAYTYLDSDRHTRGMESKYILDYLRHQVNGSMVFSWLPSLKQVIKTRYGKRMAGDSYTVVDTRLTYTLSKYEVFLEATNLFNENYIESGFTPMPDRWIMGGIKFNWN
ncbi:MAG: TonB-dependent receptor [Deltaproteobacteria bacterium]|nr:TonB-dependent receptor [Deltaproteobacteria bacterium]